MAARTWWQRGSAGLESAVTLPLLFLLLALLIWGSYAAVSRLAVAVGVAEQARAVGGASAPTTSVTNFTPLAASAASGGYVTAGVTGCQRARQASITTSRVVDVPVYGQWTVLFRGASISRIWQFQAGPAPDGCQ
jgi:hypothetical protein